MQARAAGLLTWEHRYLVIHAGKTAVAAALCWWLALRFGLHDGYWGAISSIIVLQSNFGSTIGRLARPAAGDIDWRGIWVFLQPVWCAAVELHACGACSRDAVRKLGFRSSSRLAGVTITIVMLVQQGGSHWTIALDRVLQVLLGILVALAIFYAYFSGPRTAAATRWTGAGVSCAGCVLRGDSAGISRQAPRKT